MLPSSHMGLQNLCLKCLLLALHLAESQPPLKPTPGVKLPWLLWGVVLLLLSGSGALALSKQCPHLPLLLEPFSHSIGTARSLLLWALRHCVLLYDPMNSMMVNSIIEWLSEWIKTIWSKPQACLLPMHLEIGFTDLLWLSKVIEKWCWPWSGEIGHKYYKHFWKWLLCMMHLI